MAPDDPTSPQAHSFAALSQRALLSTAVPPHPGFAAPAVDYFGRASGYGPGPPGAEPFAFSITACGAFVWVHRVLNGPSRRFSARAFMTLTYQASVFG
jgi:hypothetical protein